MKMNQRALRRRVTRNRPRKKQIKKRIPNLAHQERKKLRQRKKVPNPQAVKLKKLSKRSNIYF
jgi:hypothetical protein